MRSGKRHCFECFLSMVCWHGWGPLCVRSAPTSLGKWGPERIAHRKKRAEPSKEKINFHHLLQCQNGNGYGPRSIRGSSWLQSVVWSMQHHATWQEGHQPTSTCRTRTDWWRPACTSQSLWGFCNFSKSSAAQVHVPTTNLGMLLLGQGDCILRSKGFEGRPATANIIGTVMNLATVSLGRCCPVVSPRATNFSRDPLLTIINYVFQMGWFTTSYIRWAPDPFMRCKWGCRALINGRKSIGCPGINKFCLWSFFTPF